MAIQRDPPRSAGIASRLLAPLFWVALLLEAVFVLSMPYFVTVDGATHLGGAAALVDAILQQNTLATQFATIEILPLTNLIPEIPLGLLGWLIGPQWAEKLIVATYVVGLPAAVAYAIRGVEPARWWLAFIAIPLTFTFALNMGFYNYDYGLIGLMLGAGYLARHRGRWTRRSTIVMTLLATSIYAAHVLAFGQMVLLLGVVGLFDWWSSPARRTLSALREVLPLAIAGLPGLLLTALLIASSPPGVGPSAFSPLVSFLATIALAWGMVSFDVREIVFTTLVAGTLALLTVPVAWSRIRKLRLRSADAYLLFALAALGEVALTPSGIVLGTGGSFVAQRLGWVPVLGLLLWLADQNLSVRWPRIVALTSLVAAAGLLALRLPAYVTLSENVESIVSVAPCVATNATMLQANLGRVVPGPLDRTDALSDEAGRLTSLTHGWPVANVEFEVGFFPLRNRSETDPYDALIPPEARMSPVWEPIQRLPPTIDLGAFERSTGLPIDYVLLFGRSIAQTETLADPAWLSLERELRDSYRQVATSPNGLLEVFERSGSPAGSRGEERRAAAPDRCPPP